MSQCDELRRQPHPEEFFFSKKIKPQEISAGQRDFYARPAAQSPPSRTRHDGIPRREEAREEERRGRTGGTHMRDHVGSRRVAADLVQRVFRHRRRPAPRRRSPPSCGVGALSSSRGCSGEVASRRLLRGGPRSLISYGLDLTVLHAAFGLSVIAGLGLGLICNRAGL